MNCDYEGFEIESFGRGLWHARFRSADHEPVIIDGVLLPELNAGFAWPDPETAVADAKVHEDRRRDRLSGSGFAQLMAVFLRHDPSNSFRGTCVSPTNQTICEDAFKTFSISSPSNLNPRCRHRVRFLGSMLREASYRTCALSFWTTAIWLRMSHYPFLLVGVPSRTPTTLGIS
jgi:hypothetical protein